MKTITTTDELAAFCKEASNYPYVTVDTEFLRERTYYSKLCLVQVAHPGAPDAAVLVDPLAEELSLDPLLDLFRDESVIKVFHAARQDLEIFWLEFGVFPLPLFDTQVAAMVCGFGEQVGYETLVRKIAKEGLDKSSRFTDWSRRPLTDAQKTYAVADVTHLREIYEHLAAELERTDRARWVQEELSILTDPGTYEIKPAEAWKRVKTRTNSGKFMAYVKELAEFREGYAQNRNVPRSRVFKDDALVELASTKPKNMKDLGRSRLLLREARKGDIADGILAAIDRAGKYAPEDLPKVDRSREKLQVNPALADLLRVLLKAKADEENVAQKLIATVTDLDAIAAGERDLPALKGWRKEVFGADAIKLCEGSMGLAVKGQRVKLVSL
ncbi:MAG: ribonuclease D [Rhodobacteraceae bacterium]|nr:ribonuclease D [Paracoccaceae bacterium]